MNVPLVSVGASFRDPSIASEAEPPKSLLAALKAHIKLLPTDVNVKGARGTWVCMMDERVVCTTGQRSNRGANK